MADSQDIQVWQSSPPGGSLDLQLEDTDGDYEERKEIAPIQSKSIQITVTPPSSHTSARPSKESSSHTSSSAAAASGGAGVSMVIACKRKAVGPSEVDASEFPAVKRLRSAGSAVAAPAVSSQTSSPPSNKQIQQAAIVVDDDDDEDEPIFPPTRAIRQPHRKIPSFIVRTLNRDGGMKLTSSPPSEAAPAALPATAASKPSHSVLEDIFAAREDEVIYTQSYQAAAIQRRALEDAQKDCERALSALDMIISCLATLQIAGLDREEACRCLAGEVVQQAHKKGLPPSALFAGLEAAYLRFQARTARQDIDIDESFNALRQNIKKYSQDADNALLDRWKA